MDSGVGVGTMVVASVEERTVEFEGKKEWLGMCTVIVVVLSVVITAGVTNDDDEEEEEAFVVRILTNDSHGGNLVFVGEDVEVDELAAVAAKGLQPLPVGTASG